MLQRVLVWAAVLGAAMSIGCAPTFSLRVRQSFGPASSSCLDSAIVASPAISTVTHKRDNGRRTQYDVVLSDAMVGVESDRHRRVEVGREAGRDSANAMVTVLYSWLLPRNGPHLPAHTERLAATVAVQLLEDVRRACAPTATPAYECAYVGLSHGACKALQQVPP